MTPIFWRQQHASGARGKGGEDAAWAGSLPSLSISWNRAFPLKWRSPQYLIQTCFLQYRRPEEYFCKSNLEPLSNYILMTVIRYSAAASFLNASSWLKTNLKLEFIFQQVAAKIWKSSHVGVQPLLSLMRTVCLQQMEPHLSSSNHPWNPPLLKQYQKILGWILGWK